jgi:outer membrane immunogenic protein
MSILLRVSVASASMLLGLASAALAADLSVDVPPVMETAATDWTGFYMGVYGLGGTGVVTDTYDLVIPFDFNISGAGLGIEAGANMQTGNFVLGVHGDITGARITGTGMCSFLTCFGSGTNPTLTVDSMASLSALVGVASDSWLIYGTGGVGIAHATVNDPLQAGSDDQWHYGVIVGAGVEKQVSANVTLFGEADFAAYQGVDYALVATPDRIAFNLTTVRAGVRYHF